MTQVRKNYLQNVKSCCYEWSLRYRTLPEQGWSEQSGPQVYLSKTAKYNRLTRQSRQIRTEQQHENVRIVPESTEKGLSRSELSLQSQPV